MATAHIFIYDEIGDKISLQNVVAQFKQTPQASSITVHINSPGGDVDEGFAIHDFLKAQGLPIETIIEGKCYSIATVIALAGDTRLMSENAAFMIHNPFGGVEGEADHIITYGEWVKDLEVKIADFYSARTSLSKDDALALMAKTTFMNSNQAQEYGFITGLVAPMKAVAKFREDNFKNRILEDNMQKVLVKIEALFNKHLPIK